MHLKSPEKSSCPQGSSCGRRSNSVPQCPPSPLMMEHAGNHREAIPQKIIFSIEELVEFQYQLLSTLLQRLVSQRRLCSRRNDDASHLKKGLPRSKSMVLDELTDLVEAEEMISCEANKHFNSSSASQGGDLVVSSLSAQVKKQLRQFVHRIATMYHTRNPFHSFEHACHVTFSAYQLLRRVVSRDLPPSPVAGSPFYDPWGYIPSGTSSPESEANIRNDVLATDALAQFAILFSTLIHDVDHVGVPNAQLAKEKPTVAEKYLHRSLAEQTSVDLTWDLLEEETFHDLRECIFPTQHEYNRFRSMVVNMVMSTDIADTLLRDFREQKWQKVYGGSMDQASSRTQHDPRNDVDRKRRQANIMMDLIIMASDVSHTMQTFDVYCEWNERLFREMNLAYKEGRSECDPSRGWCLGEVIFFDKHIIPLARRLEESGLFGYVASELLENALRNRQLWQEHGQSIVTGMQMRLSWPILEQDGGTHCDDTRATTTCPTEPFSYLYGALMYLCCRRPHPAYAPGRRTQSKDTVDSEEWDEECGRLGLKRRVSHSIYPDEDTQPESDDDDYYDEDDENDCIGHAVKVEHSNRPSVALGPFSLRSRVKQL